MQHLETKHLNTIILVGRAGQHPDIKYFESGRSLATFSLAVDRPRHSPTEDAVTDWFKIELWGRQAEVAHEYIKKGSLVGIKGRLEFKHWQDAQGNNHESPFIRNINLRLLGGKHDILPPDEDPPEW